MIHVQAVTPTGDPAEPTTITVPIGFEHAQRLDRLAPLIHQLLAWDLVTRSESGAYVLQDDVQERLQAMSAVPAPVTAQVYLGRKCETCGLVRATRMVEGARVCGPCSVAASEAVAPAPDAGPDRPEHHGIRARWHRKAS
ncbi:MAG: hypothetical protein ABSF33_08455 [Acidimicrobiales bacterium]